MGEALRKSSFDELVAGISADERKYLLSKINKNKGADIAVLQSLPEDNSITSLEASFKNESLLYKIVLWVRSVLGKKSKLELYNSDLVLNLSRKVNRNHPGIIDTGSGLLQSLFYEKLKELKVSADFFKTYFSVVNDNPGRFYVFMSTFIAPEISERINKEADPYLLPFDKELTSESRISLLKKMDMILKNNQPKTRGILYASVRSIIWLKQFTELPYAHFISQFTAVASENFTCPYASARADYSSFSTVLSNPISIPTEALQALFMFPQRKSAKPVVLDGEIEKSMQDFMAKALSSISMIQMFISTVPLLQLGKIIFNNYNWQSDSTGGGEDWFVKFKEEWKTIFDSRWNEWLRDRKKAQLSSVLKLRFNLPAFPEIPSAPWKYLWGGLPFKCEMTGGFLTWFAENKFDEIMQSLNPLVLEGVFLNNENRTELSEALNNFAGINQHIITFIYSLTEQGAIGSVFQKLKSDGVRSMKNQSLADSTILNAEISIRTWGKDFCEVCRVIERILSGIFDDNKPKGYAGLQNFTTIKGRENKDFREKLLAAREWLEQARFIITEVEPLDLPGNDSSY